MNYYFSRHLIYLLILIISIGQTTSLAQNNTALPFCQSDFVMEKMLQNPVLKFRQTQIEEQIHRFLLNNPNPLKTRGAIVTLPVVVHVVHNHGSENITDAQVLKGIQDLNDAFADRGYYDPTTGVNTDIQFCLAQRTSNGTTTNGITHDVSPLTNVTMETQDLSLKNVTRWSPSCYINIWLVKEIISISSGPNVAGYAYLPSAHGSNVDGIVMEARWFGTSSANTSVLIHEMGHYLGLYHTFQGDCTNDDCLSDGDKVCDTPPDQSRQAGCNPSANSCTSDSDDPSLNNPFRNIALGGKGDVADLGDNYMDYSPLSCYSAFTQGQKDRMMWHITNVRSSLLACKSCEQPCLNPVTAAFLPRNQTINTGTTLNFTNNSTNATSFQWKISTTSLTTKNINFTFNTEGVFKVALTAISNDVLCVNASDSIEITVICPVSAGFTTPSQTVKPNTNTVFTSSSKNATSVQWKVNNVIVGTSTTLNYTFPTVGNYTVELIAKNNTCSASQSITIVVQDDLPCKNDKFKKIYLSDNPEVVDNDFLILRQTRDNNYLGAGTRKLSSGASEGIIAKIDTTGNIIWSKNLSIGRANYLVDAKPTSDGGYITCGLIDNYATIIKLTANGTVAWTKQYTNQNNSLFTEIIETSDGGYAITGLPGYYSDTYVVKLNANGTEQWAKIIGSTTSDWSNSIQQGNDGHLVVVSNTTSTTYTIIMKLDINTGNIIWQKQYESGSTDPSTDHSFDHMSKTPDGGFIITGNYSKNEAVFQKIDASGKILWAKKISETGEELRGVDCFQTSDGGYQLILHSYSGNKERRFLKLNANFDILWQKKIGTGGETLYRSIIPFNNGNYLIGSHSNKGILLTKTDALVNSCEPFENANLQLSNLNLNVENASFSIYDATPMQSINMIASPLELIPKNICPTCIEICNNGIDDDGDGLIDKADVLDCPCNSCLALNNTIKINGADTVCLNVLQGYKLKLKQPCTIQSTWDTQNFATKVNSSMDSITLRFTQSGDFKLIASISDTCQTIKDTLNIHVLGNAPLLELGADKTVCQTGVFTFRAGKGFKSYQWQDGSIDSTFTAFEPGKYWVTVKDSCGGVQSDTVRINLSPITGINFSPDTLTMCESDSLILNVPSGYKTYRWYPSQGVSDTTKQKITLTPSVSTKYFLAVSTLAGCISQDSVFVFVKPLTRNTRDVAICQGQNYTIGDSILTKSGLHIVKIKSKTGGCDTITTVNLSIITNFTKLIDSAICNGQKLVVGDSIFTKTGTFTVNLKGNGRSCDTITKVNLIVKSPSRITLNKAICTGDTFTIGDSIFTKTGTYSVLINKILCQDTLYILNLKVNAIKVQATSFSTCPNSNSGKITLQYKGGTPPYNFIWNTGQQTSSLSALAAGNYIVTISDKNGCSNIAQTSIIVSPPLQYNLSIKNASCYGDVDGEIKIQTNNSLSIGFDSTIFNKNGYLNYLKAGSYEIFVKDTNNCIKKEIITINQPPALSITMPKDTLLHLGDSVTISPTINVNNDIKYRWTPPRFINCDTCLNPTILGITQTKYLLNVSDSKGCKASASFTVYVDKDCKIFVPNVFSPNASSETNSVLVVYGSDCAKRIRIIQIFDRWGGLVFSKNNINLNDPLVGWDGTFNGKVASAAVYTYWLEIELIDGRIERLTGDINLIR